MPNIEVLVPVAIREVEQELDEMVKIGMISKKRAGIAKVYMSRNEAAALELCYSMKTGGVADLILQLTAVVAGSKE